MICGKTLAHWFFKQPNEIYGGFPPTLDYIKIEPNFVNLFVESLFACKTQLINKTNFRRIFSASIMIFHYEFVCIIGNVPYSKYKDTTHHTFHKNKKTNSETKNQWRPFASGVMKSLGYSQKGLVGG